MFLDARRVAPDQNAAQVAQEGAARPISACQTLVAGDSRYSTSDFIYPLAAEMGTNVVVRMRHNRVLFRPPPVAERPSRGHPAGMGRGSS